MGSWLEGSPGDDSRHSGSKLGLPAAGPGSMAPLGRRVLALMIDWLVCLLISNLAFGGHAMATLAVFAVENVLLVSTLGYTLGHRILGLQVRGLAGPGQMVGFVRGATRAVLLCLVLPAVVWDSDGRGMHDRAAGTVIVRL